MSVPLDRLYNYLNDVVNHDIVIYRWSPHGSKKLEDLSLLTNVDKLSTIVLPSMICHDQEPLDYHQYDSEFAKNKDSFDLLDLPIDLAQGIKDVVSHSNLQLISANSIYEKILLLHSELNSSQEEIYKNNNFLPVYYWSHGIIARDWFRHAEHDPALTKRVPKLPFLIYNRAWSGTREYRLKFAELIAKSGLSTSCKMGFSPVDTDQKYQMHKFKNSAFCIDSTNLENYFFENTSSSNASADYVSKDYQETQIEVVLETLFDDERWHLTEKSLRPIACGHPFILVATAGSLGYLRSYGFETFDGLIDETYDTIKDPVQRLQAIIYEMQRLVVEGPAIWDQLQAIADRNKQRFFSNEFHTDLINEYCDNIQSAVQTLDTYRTCKNWDLMYQIAKYCQRSNQLPVLDQVIQSLPFCVSNETKVNPMAESMPLLESVNDYIKTLK